MEELLLSKLDSHVAGTRELPSDVDRLRNSLPRVNRLMDKAEWWRFRDQYIARLLDQLRDAAYDAEDVIAQFDYYQLQQKIEGQITSQPLSSLTSFTKEFYRNSVSKVKDVQNKLGFISGELEKVISPLGSPDGPNPYGKAVQQETSSFVPELMLGREKEVEMIIKLMLHSGDGAGSSNEASSSSMGGAKRRKTSNFSVLPIVGIGGVGKTTLAQQIYNDDRVKEHFDLKIWVCVSDYFDLKKITKEMIESVNRELEEKKELRNTEKQIIIGDNLTNLDSLQQILKGKLVLRRYLIVLDDVWHEKARDWETLFNPLKFGLDGSMVLVTTRISKVAEISGTLDPIELVGLPDGIYWELFKTFAFGSNTESSYLELEDIGKRIAAKLKGSPLAAKTLGGILCANRTIKQWRNILDSELWQLEQDDDGILAALRVSYQYLPVYLKRCFLMCSLFPKDFDLQSQVGCLVPVLMADGIILPEKRNSRDEYSTDGYIGQLVSRSFILKSGYKFVLHDLMHDLARSLSLNTCYCQEDNNLSLENHNSVRHLSVYRKPFELIDTEISKCKKLRSLLILDDRSSNIKLGPSTLMSLFNQLPNLRLLDLSKCQIQELPENIGNLKLLFCINLCFTKIRSLPVSFCQLYNLQFLYVENCPLESFPEKFNNLINLQRISGISDKSSKIPGIGKLTSLLHLSEFKVLKKDGHRIEELKNMTQLRNSIKISNLENVEDGRDATQACLNKKDHLTRLTLSWSPGRDTIFENGGTVTDEDILEGLEPHPNLECLIINNYEGRKPASWFRAEKLPCLCTLLVGGCSNLESLNDWFVPHELLSLQSLEIRECAKLVSLSLEWIRSSAMTELETINCKNLVSLPFEWISSSSIAALIIRNCPMLSCPSNLILPSSLSGLFLDSCGEVDKSLPSCLENVHSLKWLSLRNCQHVTSIPCQVTNHLESLEVSNCPELQCLELSNGSILNSLYIKKCPKLIQSDPSTVDNEAPAERITKLSLTIDETSFLKLPFLRNRSIDALSISGSPEERIYMGDVPGWLNGPETLGVYFEECSNLESLPKELHTLVSVKSIGIINCPKIQSLPENGLPPSLTHLYFQGCHPALTEQLERHQKAIMEGRRK